MAKITVNGASLFYEDTGGPGEVILFHHGYTGSHDSWEHVVPALKNDYRCIIMDCRGAGDSEHTADGYSIAQYANDVIGVVDALGIDRFTYVGHSMGGAMGMELGIRYGSRLNRLVLVAPAPADGRDFDLPATEAGHRAGRELQVAKDRVTMIAQRMGTSAWPEYDRIARAVDRALSVSMGHYDGSWESMKAFRACERLHEITTPTLVIAGAADSLLRANLRDFQALPNATLHVFSRISHGVHQEQAEPFLAVLRDFMTNGVVTASSLLRDYNAGAKAEPVAAR